MSKRFLKIYMDVTNKCNLQCTMCYFALPVHARPAEFMGLGLFSKIAEDIFPRALSVNLSCAAEPFLSPDMGKFLDITKKFDIPETLIVTNGLLLNKKIIETMIDSSLTQIDISIDGATKKTYESIRKGSDFEKLIKNIELLNTVKKEKRADRPLLYLDYALMRSTLDELPDFMHLAEKLHADSVRVNHLIPFKTLGNIEDSLINFREKTNTILDKTRKIISSLGINAVVPENFDLSRDQENKPILNKPGCTVPFDSIYIASNGDVLPCIWFSRTKWLLGNLSDRSFNTIWNSDDMNRLRKDFKDGNMTEFCINCPVYGGDPLKNYVFTERDREDIGNITP